MTRLRPDQCQPQDDMMNPPMVVCMFLVVVMLLACTVTGSHINSVAEDDKTLSEANKQVKEKVVTRSDECQDFGDECGWFSGCCERMTCQYETWTSGHCWYDW